MAQLELKKRKLAEEQEQIAQQAQLGDQNPFQQQQQQTNAGMSQGPYQFRIVGRDVTPANPQQQNSIQQRPQMGLQQQQVEQTPQQQLLQQLQEQVQLLQGQGQNSPQLQQLQ